MYRVKVYGAGSIGTHLARGHFWARGYAASTVGFQLGEVRTYIGEHESADEQGRF